MAIYASPFFQNILSLTENCIPPPPITTYEVNFRDPYVRRKGNKYVEKDSQQLLASLKLAERKKHDPDKVPVKSHYCTPHSFEGSKKYQKDLKGKRLCSKRITTYMVDYQSPFEKKKLWELYELNSDVENVLELKDMIKSGDEIQKMFCPANDNKTDDIEESNKTKDEQMEQQKEVPPRWKVEGWKAKKNCWLRPLKERREYYDTLEFRQKRNDCPNKDTKQGQKKKFNESPNKYTHMSKSSDNKLVKKCSCPKI